VILTLRTGRPIEVNDVTIIPIEKVKINGEVHSNRLVLQASLEPVGVVIRHQNKEQAFDTNGNPVTVDSLLHTES
jgi:hypothetical protein